MVINTDLHWLPVFIKYHSSLPWCTKPLSPFRCSSSPLLAPPRTTEGQTLRLSPRQHFRYRRVLKSIPLVVFLPPLQPQATVTPARPIGPDQAAATLIPPSQPTNRFLAVSIPVLHMTPAPTLPSHILVDVNPILSLPWSRQGQQASHLILSTLWHQTDPIMAISPFPLEVPNLFLAAVPAVSRSLLSALQLLLLRMVSSIISLITILSLYILIDLLLF